MEIQQFKCDLCTKLFYLPNSITSKNYELCITCLYKNSSIDHRYLLNWWIASDKNKEIYEKNQGVKTNNQIKRLERKEKLLESKLVNVKQKIHKLKFPHSDEEIRDPEEFLPDIDKWQIRYFINDYDKTYYPSGFVKRAIEKSEKSYMELNFNENGMFHGRYYCFYEDLGLWNLKYENGFVIDGVFLGNKIVYIKNNTVYQINGDKEDILEFSTKLLNKGKLKTLPYEKSRPL